MFLTAAAIKITSDFVTGTMANAGDLFQALSGLFKIKNKFSVGSSQPMMFVAPVNRQVSTSERVHTAQPTTRPKNQPPATFVKFHNQELYLGSEPIFITCPSCFDLITTKVIYENGERSQGCFCCSNTMKDALHYCPSCHAYLGKFTP